MTSLETLKYFPLLTAELTLFLIFKVEAVIGSIIFFPWLVAYFYKKSNAIPWSVFEKNPNTMI